VHSTASTQDTCIQKHSSPNGLEGLAPDYPGL